MVRSSFRLEKDARCLAVAVNRKLLTCAGQAVDHFRDDGTVLYIDPIEDVRDRTSPQKADLKPQSSRITWFVRIVKRALLSSTRQL